MIHLNFGVVRGKSGVDVAQLPNSPALQALRRPGEPLGVKAPGFFDQAHVQGECGSTTREAELE